MKKWLSISLIPVVKYSTHYFTWVEGVFECKNFISVSQSGWISHLYFWSLLYWAINIKGTTFHLA